jgi:hypothetical protein
MSSGSFRWEPRKPDDSVLSYAQLIRSSLDRAVAMMAMLPERWKPIDGSPAARELALAGATDEALQFIQSRLSLLLLGSAGMAEAMACALEGNALVGVPPLSRQTMEHVAAVAWILDPNLLFDQRIARVLLLEDESLEQDLRGRVFEIGFGLCDLDCLF